MRILIIITSFSFLFSQDLYLNVTFDPQGWVFSPDEQITFQAENGLDERTLTIQWDFGDGTRASGNVVQHSYAQSGQYQINVFGTTAQAEKSQVFYAPIFINAVNGDDRVDAFIVEPSSFVVAQAGSTVRFEGASNFPVNYFFWELAGSNVTHRGATFDYQVPRDLDDDYLEIRLFAVNSDGFASIYPDYRSIYVYQTNIPPEGTLISPSLDEEGVYAAELGESVVFEATGIDVDGTAPLAYFWTVDKPSGTVTGEGSTFQLQADEQGFYYGYVDVISPDGGYDPFPPEFYVWVRGDANENPVVWSQHGTLTAYEGEALSMGAGGYDVDGDEITFNWDLGDGRQMTGETISVIYETAGPYVVTITAVDSLGGQSNRFETWALINRAVPTTNIEPQAAIITPKTGEMFMEGSTVSFKGQGYDYEGGGVDYFWSFGDGVTANGEMIDRVFSCDDDSSCLLDLELYVRDEGGLFSWYGDYVTTAIYKETRPPNGLIVAPKPVTESYNQPVHQMKPGENVSLVGDVEGGDRSGADAVWRFYQGDEFFEVNGFEPQAISYESFPSTGFWDAYFHVTSDLGIEDPIADSVIIWVRDSNEAPHVEIAMPGPEVAIDPGGVLDLSAYYFDNDGDDVSLEWILSDGRRFTGDYVAEVKFEQPGLFWLDLIARDGELEGESRALVRRYIIVNPSSESEVGPPELQLLGPFGDDLVGPVGSRYHFLVDVEDGYEGTVTEWLWDLGNGDIRSTQNPGIATYIDPGPVYVRVFARNSNGLWTPSVYAWRLFIYGSNVPPNGVIVEPALRMHSDFDEQHVMPVLINSEIRFNAIAQDPDGDLPLYTTWYVDGETYSFDLTPPPLMYSERGQHLIDFYVTDARDLDDPFGDYRYVKVADPSLKPESYISSPDGDITVEPGQELYFSGYGEDPNELEMNYQWDFGPEANIATVSGPEADEIVFNSESPPNDPYIVRFTARTQFTVDPTPAELRVTVKSYQDNDFEPNNSLDEAKDIQQGTYSNLSLDAGAADQSDVFRFSVDQPGRDLRLHIKSQQGEHIGIELFRFIDGDWQAFGIATQSFGSNTLVSENLPIGTYAVEIKPGSSKKRDGIPYGFGIGTEKPALYLPFVVEDGVLKSNFGIINPFGETVDLAIVGLDSNGKTVDTKTHQLAPYGRMRASSLAFFGSENRIEKARSVVWLKIQSTQRMVGYMTAESLDGSQLFSTGAIGSLMPSLVVPHIAVRTDQWYTRAITIDTGAKRHSLDFVSPASATEITGTAGVNRQQDFRFADVFDTLPSWGRFSNREGEATLAGVELFGRVDGARQVAGLNYIYDRGSNPNFFQLERSLYFPHVATDTANFWTGISIINPSQSESVLEIVAYDNAGIELVRQSEVRLPAGGKILNTVTGLFPGIQGISWLRVDTTETLEGFELFGDHQDTRLAGFEAPRFASDLLYFPYIGVSDSEWTGIALVNVAAESVVVTFTAFDNSGQELIQTNVSLAARTKFLALAQDIFGAGLPDGITYITAQADQKSIVAFELFGSLVNGGLGGRMAGLLALTP